MRTSLTRIHTDPHIITASGVNSRCDISCAICRPSGLWKTELSVGVHAPSLQHVTEPEELKSCLDGM